jgi:hypothetical protein
MFTPLSTSKSAAYWEGWQAVELHRQCQYTDLKGRREWSKGFADGVIEMRGSKVWYKSRTMIIGIVLLLIGIGLFVYGIYSGGSTMIGAGAGTTASSILMTALRLISSTNISITGAGGQYTPQAP